MLNNVLKSASESAASVTPLTKEANCAVNHKNGDKSTKAIIPLHTLKRTCTAAKRRALAVAPREAKTMVDVVPIFAPITPAAANARETV